MKVIKLKKKDEGDEIFVKLLFAILIIGIIFILPPLLGVVSFIGNLFGADAHFFTLWNLSSRWTAIVDNGGGISAAPIYLGLMAIAGAIFIIGAFAIFFYLVISFSGINSIDSIEIEEKKAKKDA